MTELCYKAQESDQMQLTESLIQYVLICGMKDSKHRVRLLMQPDLNLQRTIQTGQTAEETKIQTKILDTTSERRPAEKAHIWSSNHYKKWRKNARLPFPEMARILTKTQDHISKVKLTTVVEGYQEAPFSIAVIPRCRGWLYSFPWIALLYPWYIPYIIEC